ncbi:3-methyladenine DNA glycosylase [Propionibacteriaceae bacterium G1746]
MTGPRSSTLSGPQWRERRDAHAQRAQRLLADVIERRSHGDKHPVEDFMFDYYRLRPGQLLEWHPGVGVELEDADDLAHRRWYTRTEVAGCAVVGVDAEAFVAARGTTLDFTQRLLRATATRPAQFGCFGMHEWAMVYGLDQHEARHAGVPLRFSVARTREIVDANGLRCTHYDAFRFFTDEAAPMNQRQLSRDDQVDTDQGGCLHVNMDLYKFAGKLLPLTPSELLLDTYELALDIRELDMRASAYDLSGWGYEPVTVETPAGKATYVAMQRGFAARAEVLRGRLLDVIARAPGQG